MEVTKAEIRILKWLHKNDSAGVVVLGLTVKKMEDFEELRRKELAWTNDQGITYFITSKGRRFLTNNN